MVVCYGAEITATKKEILCAPNTPYKQLISRAQRARFANNNQPVPYG